MESTSNCANFSTTAATTTSSYVAGVTVGNCRGAIFNIQNLTAETMYYKIIGYLSNYPTAAAITITDETSIAAGTTTDLAANHPYAKIIVYVKSNSGACSYIIDYILY
jgi:hypothetical protein